MAWINPRLKPGERRKVVTGIPGKTGLVYTLDRATGEFLWARPTVMQNVIKSIDGATGEVTVNPEALFTKLGETKLICPSAQGGKNWPAGAYNPRTNVMFMPMQNMCGNTRPPPTSAIRRRSTGSTSRPSSRRAPTRSAACGRSRPRPAARCGSTSSAPACCRWWPPAGGLVFGGDANGRFRAFDDRTGKVLWETNLGSPVSGYPITFAVDGKQYVAVTTGPSRRGHVHAAPDAGAEAEQHDAGVVFALP